MTAERISVAELVERLGRLRPADREAVLAFDGDGTLWTGDVAEDVFHTAVAERLLREPAREPLERTARAHGLTPAGTPSETAGSLWAAYLDGRFPERTVCEVMTWCFAGWSYDELSAFARRVLAERELHLRLNRTLGPVFDLARATAMRVIVVSASPAWVVVEAAKQWGIAADQIAGGVARTADGRVAPELALPIPYAEAKVAAGRALVGGGCWLASFGDSPFDLDLLGAARLGVAVRPRPSLLARLGELPSAVILAD